MRVPSARYVSQRRIASLKGISLISKQLTHLHNQAASASAEATFNSKRLTCAQPERL